ncbi:MAG: saccharopine dehydrogenase NADP-binding domain-containing protein [Sphingobacteriaceae bacterium]|nr:saccharopine dehydrogenase NADP-binding domain-containing protein [Sphingobacteriaceae bacterium]
MKKILVIGAGRSSGSLITYLLKNATSNNWFITVTDMNLAFATEKVKGYSNCEAKTFDVTNDTQRKAIIEAHDAVVSMLPATMHGSVAKDCVSFGKHLFTASYVSAEMKELDKEAKQKGVLLMNEIGLDPGIDHASAMKIIHDLQAKGANIISFRSYCGGLVAPESNDNPWGYKFSWNPRNVVVAGQSAAQYISEGKLKFIPPSRIFTQIDTINVERYGAFDAYANRDSISYQEPYGLKNIKTLLRGTLRTPGYCEAWNVFVRLGLTDDTYKIHEADKLTYTQLLDSVLPPSKGTIKDRLKEFMGKEFNSSIEEKLNYLELFSERKIKLKEASPAQLLQDLLEEKWKLKQGDKDMIVMQHLFDYELNGKTHHLTSSLVVLGDDENHTAMAKTVGLPLAITLKNFLEGKFKLSGVQIPIVKDVYSPLLQELESLGIKFDEKEN